MCDSCFRNEIKAFTTAEEFANFDSELKQKLRLENGLYYIRRSNEINFYDYDIYGCKNCHTTWCLNVPNTTTIGFLLLEENCRVLLEEAKKKASYWRTRTIIFWLAVMLICIFVILSSIN